MKRIIFILSIASLIIVSSCTKKKSDCLEGTIKDRTGLDGCGLLIELDNGTVLEPYSIPEGKQLTAGKRVCVRYEPMNDRASICMAGIISKITTLDYLP